jgi:hypothetical protein
VRFFSSVTFSLSLSLSLSLCVTYTLSKFNGNFIRIQSPYLWNFRRLQLLLNEAKKKHFSFFAIKKGNVESFFYTFFTIIFISSIFEILNHSGGKIFPFFLHLFMFCIYIFFFLQFIEESI